ncbi:MAG: VWA domain-containing protein [Luteolibacter sp.]|uniref:VWA domain-containing protein n=1 Tax=Luteolibacter sp. TaxID=1962973 RepID=UPI003267847A
MSFIHAAFLAAGLAVAVPWLLHLTKKRKYLRIRLGSLQFLDPIVRDRHRMSRIEQWPLLIARCLAILLLAFVFARPFFPKPAPVPPAAGEFLVLLDASGSITLQQANVIRKQARKTIESLPKATRPVIAAVSDQVTVLSSLDDYKPIPGSPSGFSPAVDWIVDRAASAPDAMAGVHWFTDLQRSPLPAAPSRLWPSGLSVEMHPVLPPTDRNVAVEQVDLLTPFGGDHWEIEARVHVYGMPGNEPLNLLLTSANGKMVTATTPADGGSVRFIWDGDAKDGILAGDVSVVRAGDSWPADDRRPFAFQTSQPKRIALVDGDPGDSPFLSETYFLEKALHASAAGKALSPFRATVSTSIPSAGERIDAVALCNMQGLSSAEARLLQTHLDQGAGLAIFLGDRTVPAEWSAAATLGIFPNGLRAFVEPAPAFLRRSDLTHPGLAGLTQESARGLGLVALMRRFTWPPDAGWKSAMEFDDASPLVAFSNKGKIAVVTHPMNREGSDLPLDPSFVPFVQGIFGYLARPPADGGHARSVANVTPGHEEIREPGIYENGTGITLVTADVTESDISNSDEKSFREVLGLPALNAPPPEIVSPAAEADSSHLREGELWPWILAVLLALLTVESVLAARRIRQTATPDVHVN